MRAHSRHSRQLRSGTRQSSEGVRSLTAAAACVALALLLLAGCGGKQPCSASGRVTYQGAAIESGNIRFDPVSGTAGPSASSKITGGSYSIPLTAGMVPGEYVVRITATRSTGRFERPREVLPGESDAPVEVFEQYLPDDFHAHSNRTVQFGPAANEIDFDL